MDYQELLPRLTLAKIRYLVAGAVGGILSGYFRTTADLDLLVDLKRQNLRRVVAFMESIRHVPRVPVPPSDLLDPRKRRVWRRDKGLRAFTFIDPKQPFGNIDLMIFSPVPFSDAWKRRETVYLQETEVHVASLADLIALKQDAIKNRSLPKDEIDLKALEELRLRRSR